MKIDKAGIGRARQDSNRIALDTTHSKWRDAPNAEKEKTAKAILSQVGSQEGRKLADCFDEKTAQQIRKDANL